MNIKGVLKIMGPGLLYAGAAIGVSHLVQSTRAGSSFNFDLLWVLIFANLVKYPFFDYGTRYATATGNSLIEGYAKIGRWAVDLFTVLTVVSMFVIEVAITVVTAGLFSFIFNIHINTTVLAAFLLLLSIIILAVGKYSMLDRLMKTIIILLSVTTVVAVFAALDIPKEINPEFITRFNFSNKANIFFLIAFVGWMPAPIDVSVWTSLWNVEKAKELGYRPKLKEALAEFRFGYVGTAILAIGFLSLGALVMFGTGEKLSPNGTVFAQQLINMYTKSIGNWSYWIISIAAFTTMYSTTITVLDAYARVLTPLYSFYFPKSKAQNTNRMNNVWLFVIFGGTLAIILFFAKSMRSMVDLATTLSFVFSPALAWINYKTVTSNHFPEEARPGSLLKILSWIGIVFFTVFTLIYLVWRFFL
ncbi:MAG: Nramp family divalent metal transporter [Bacteroidales bacterium]|nr:Nramp family divalent metal transporter [Bacteroidales bacterium]